MTRKLKWLLIPVVLLAPTVGWLVWYNLPIRSEFYTDADTIRAPRAAAPIRDILWQPPVKLDELLNTAGEDYEPRLSWDGLTLFFVRGKAGHNADIYTARRTPTGWTQPQPLAAVNSQAEDLGPAPSADGTALYFYSDRSGGLGGYDLWVARQTEDGWQTPTNLGPAVNSEFNDYGPAPAPDGTTLYFSSNRPRVDDARRADPDAWPATVREDLFHRTYDLYAAEVTPRGFATARPLDDLNTPNNESTPCLSPAGDFLYFSSDRGGGQGGFDLYRARLIRGSFEKPENLGAGVNTPANELDPGLTHLGYALYFSSDRPLKRLNPETPNDYNMYYSAAREVYLDSDQLHRPPIDWAALLRDNWPYLLWGLLGLLALLLLLALVGSMRDGKLGLLARCLLASLMLHLLLMVGFSFWKVSASVLTAFRQRGEIRVALASPQSADALVAQLRGDLTEVAPPRVEQPDLAAPETALEMTPRESVADITPGQTRIEFASDPATALAVREAQPRWDAETPLREPRLDDSFTPDTSDVALPQETVQVEVPENRPEVAVDFDVAARIVRPVPIATSQPVRREQIADLAPSKHVQDLDGGAASMALEVTPAPAAARSEDRPAVPAVRPPAAQTADLARLDVSLPSAAAPRAEVEEPRDVAPAPLAEASDTSAPPMPVMTARVAPMKSEAFTADAPPIALPADEAPRSWMPPVAAKVPSDTQPPPTARFNATMPSSAAPQTALALPTMEEQRSQEQTESQSSAATPRIASSTLAEAAPLPVLPNKTAPHSGLVALDTNRKPRLDESSTAELIARPANVSRMFNAAPPPISSAVPLELRAAAPAFNLDLPNEVEPPAAHEQPGNLHPPIRGRVVDATTEQPIVGATIRLDLPETEPLTVKTDAEGMYALAVPAVPEHFALSAAHEKYVPQSVSIPAALLDEGLLNQDFALSPKSADVIALEIEPEVHHLGNDRFEGVINSQFQKESEGQRFQASFELTAEQLQTPPRRAVIRLMAKGVQCPHRMFINGTRLRRRLDEAPDDGSFGELAARIPVELLVEGENLLEIQAVSCSGDLDDFEFVNVRIELTR